MGEKARQQVVQRDRQGQLRGVVAGSGAARLRNLGRLLSAALLLGILTTHVAQAEETPRVAVPLLDSPARGPATAPVTMIEFVDFQ